MPKITSRRYPRSAVALLSALALAGTGVVLTAGPASAAQIEVTDLGDSGPGTLRAAVDAANLTPGTDTVTFQTGLTGTILVGDTIDINRPISIDGPGADAITLALDTDADMFRVDLYEAGDISFSGLTLFGDSGTYDGRGIDIYNDDQQTDDVTITDCVLDSFITSGWGGAMVVDAISGNLTVTGTTFTGNEAEGDGGALSIDGVEGNVSVSNSTFDDNESSDGAGGAVAIMNVDGTISITNSVFTRNVADSYGGALRLPDVGSEATITGSTFLTNEAGFEGGAIQVEELFNPLTIGSSIFSDNSASRGGAVMIYFGQLDTAANELFSVNDSTFSDNSAEAAGGAIASSVGTLDETDAVVTRIDSSTFTNNQLDSDYGMGLSLAFDGIGGVEIVNSTFNESSTATLAPYVIALGPDHTLTLSHSTVIGPGGVLLVGVYQGEFGVAYGTADITHTIIESTASVDASADAIGKREEMLAQKVFTTDDGSRTALQSAPPVARATLTGDVTIAWSILTTGADPTFVTLGAGVQLNATNLALGALQNNGGPTMTMLLGDASPALNAGDPAVTGTPAFDQRGSGFPRIVGTIDIGAIEMPAAETPDETPESPDTSPDTSLAATGGTINLLIPIGAGVLLVLGALAFVLGRRRARRSR